jgi:hypothetical protein
LSIADSNAIRFWFDQKKVDPRDEEDLLELMQQFCAFVGKDPDEIVGECFKSQGGLNYKKRRLYSDEIGRFTQTLEGEERARVQSGNVVRSFFIHNGVRLFAPTAPWLG